MLVHHTPTGAQSQTACRAPRNPDGSLITITLLITEENGTHLDNYLVGFLPAQDRGSHTLYYLEGNVVSAQPFFLFFILQYRVQDPGCDLPDSAIVLLGPPA